MENFQTMPVPHDIPLDLPLPEWLLIVLLIVSFLMHIVFVNLMVGGTFLTFWAELKGRKNKDYDILAQEIAKTITVNKSLAVVLGVAPLLSINALYTIYFYSANALTGVLWISIIPIVSVAFLLLYWHKYSWKKYENNKGFHFVLIGIASVLFLFVPLIFLTNINLMLFPEEWGNINGFWDALMLSNVFPRYLHFLTASLAVTGLFLFGWMKRKKYVFDGKYENLTKDKVLRIWYKVALHTSLLQIVFGPLVFFTLPWKGVTWDLAYIIIAGIIFAITAIVLLWMDLKNKTNPLGKHFGKVVIALTITVMFMATGRHAYRAVVLGPHQKAVAEKTMLFKIQSDKAREKYEAESNIMEVGLQIDNELDILTRRNLYKLFKDNKAITFIRFDLDKQLIIMKYKGSDITIDAIINSIKNMNYNVLNQYSLK